MISTEVADVACLAATKFHAPARRHDALLRTRLIRVLKDSLAKVRLALISAPAGSGKTSLLAELPHAFPEKKWAWLLLDEEDNDPSRFAAALTSSLEAIDPFLTAGALAGPFHAANPGMQAVTAIINNAVRSPDAPFVLVIDDYHLIREDSVHQILHYLIERLPANMRVIVASRHDPPVGISKWRARGELVELRLSDLAFTQDEVEALIHSCLDLSLHPEDVRALHERTEGWAAGLRLLATSIALAPPDTRAVLRQGIEGPQRVFEFLAEEVLDQQPNELRRFLLETSVLTSLSPQTCDALTGRLDSRRVLDDLYRRNLFVVAAGESGLHYRYHDLFSDFLRDRLRRERGEDWVSLHDRAARVETEPGRRVHHWMTAGNWESAAAEIERIGAEYMRRGFAFTLRRWLLEIPAQIRRGHPRLAYLLGSAIWARSEFNAARPFFEEALAGFRELKDPAGQGETLVALSVTATMSNEAERAQNLFQEALTFPLPPSSCVELHAATGWDAVNRRDWIAVRRSLDSLLDLVAEPAVVLDAFAMQLLVAGTCLPEFTDRLEETLDRLGEHVQSSDLSRAYYHTLQAACRLFRGDMAGGRRASELALSTMARSEQPLTVRLANVVARSLACYAEGDWEGVERIANQLIESDREALLIRSWGPMVTYLAGRARWLAGNLAGFDECLQRIPVQQAGEWPQTHIYRLFLSGIQHLCTRSFAQAERAFQEARDLEQDYRLTAGHSSATVLLAYTHLKRGHTEPAMEAFLPYLAQMEQLDGPGYLLRENPIVVPLLRIAHERNHHRLFAERILGILGVPVSPTAESGQDSLSCREVEVLRVMAEGITNRDIGKRLFVSETTVKTHVQRILRKLDASSRTQAVSRARDLMLL